MSASKIILAMRIRPCLQSRSPRVLRAFALIELLTVMSIILMLVGLLLPALAQARSVARGAQCGSNQHQIGVGTSLFSGDWNDLVPREGLAPWKSIPGLGKHIPWINAVRPYLAGQLNLADVWSPVFRDPAHPNPNHPVHYVVNGIAFESERGPSVRGRIVAGRPTPRGGTVRRTPST